MAKKKPYRFFLYLFARAVAGAVFLLPRVWALGLAKQVGRLSFWIVSRQREKTLHHLRIAFDKEKSETEIGQIGCEVFENLAMTGAEMLQFSKLNLGKILGMVEGTDAGYRRYDEILARGRGLISITAHIGNWELLAGIMFMNGCRGAVLGKRIYYEPYNRWVLAIRDALKIPVIDREQSTREILKRLANNEAIGLLPDQDMDRTKGIYVPFFGRPAYTSVAVARLSIASGAAILPNFLVRKEDKTYRLILGDTIEPNLQTDRDEETKRMTEAWMQQFEKVIRQYPGQWAWMHNRWRTQKENHG